MTAAPNCILCAGTGSVFGNGRLSPCPRCVYRGDVVIIAAHERPLVSGEPLVPEDIEPGSIHYLEPGEELVPCLEWPENPEDDGA